MPSNGGDYDHCVRDLLLGNQVQRVLHLQSPWGGGQSSPSPARDMSTKRVVGKEP